jgi:RNA polymerase sigma-70 factor (ECF subfamily)
VAAFEAFVREYQDMVFATAVRLLGRAVDAEDVAQTVFLRAFEHFDEIKDSPSVPGWLKTVTTNLCLNHLSRYRARWQFFSEMPTEPGDPSFEESIAAPETDEPEFDVTRQARLEEALQALPAHQRVPLVLFHFQDRTYQDIAAMLGISMSKVKTDIHRGRAALRRAVEAGS